MSTGQLIEPACRAWLCEDCGPRKARRLGIAIDRAGYDRFLTITNAPSDLLQGVARLAFECRRTAPMEWIWSAECAPLSGMLHVHACVRGWIEHRRDGTASALDRACRQAGWGTVSWVEPAAGGAGRYAAKAARYASKESRGGYSEWVNINGGKRPWHWSRGYTGGASMRAWLKTVLPSSDAGPWVPTSAPARHLRGVLE